MYTSLLILVAWSGVAQIHTAPSGEELERQILSTRLELASGRLSLLVEDVGRERVFQCELLFDGPKRRFEIIRPPHSFPGASGEPENFSRLETYVVNEEEYLHHVTELRDNPKSYVAHVENLREIHELELTDPRAARRRSMYKQAFDPRIIGVATQQFGHWWNVELTSLAITPQDTERTVFDELEEESGVWKLERRYASGVVSELWVNPQKGFNLIRARTTGVSEHGKIVDVMSTELAQYPSGHGDVWFPSSVWLHRELPNGICCEWIVRVESAEFNRPVPSELFTLAGLDLPVGALVALPQEQRSNQADSIERGPRRRKWDGDSLVELTPEDMESLRVSTLEDTRGAENIRPRVTALIAINVIIVGLLVFVAWARKR